LLADPAGNFGEFALVRTDRREVVGPADEVEGAKGFPNLFVAGGDSGDFGPCGYVIARRYRKGADAAANGGAELDGLLSVLRCDRRAVRLQFGNQSALMDGGADFVRVGDAARAWRRDFCGLQERDDLRTAGSVTKTYERKSGVTANHRRRIPKHLEKRPVKPGRGSVLAHDPGVSVADFFDGMRGEADQFRIPPRHLLVAAAHALTELNESVLDVARALFILQVLRDLFVRKTAPKPGVPPEEEGHQDDQPGGDKKERAVARRHFVMRGGGELLRGRIKGNFGVGGSLWGRWWSGHVVC
jgi:hypothetical protein